MPHTSLICTSSSRCPTAFLFFPGLWENISFVEIPKSVAPRSYGNAAAFLCLLKMDTRLTGYTFAPFSPTQTPESASQIRHSQSLQAITKTNNINQDANEHKWNWTAVFQGNLWRAFYCVLNSVAWWVGSNKIRLDYTVGGFSQCNDFQNQHFIVKMFRNLGWVLQTH